MEFYFVLEYSWKVGSLLEIWRQFNLNLPFRNVILINQVNSSHNNKIIVGIQKSLCLNEFTLKNAMNSTFNTMTCWKCFTKFVSLTMIHFIAWWTSFLFEKKVLSANFFRRFLYLLSQGLVLKSIVYFFVVWSIERFARYSLECARLSSRFSSSCFILLFIFFW